ncbi:MAG: hypothetical protein HY905_06745 [Deltaproteobacteria bacterium]|nr:hypothetical protein [Deltaproteobacteria bacterium]
MNVRTISVLCLVATMGLAGSARASVGGPDRFGYGWKDSDEAGVTYSWDDVGTTNCVTLNDDAESAAIPIGFTFNFYGTDYTQVRIGSNGYVAFQSNVLSGFVPQCPLPQDLYGTTTTQTVNLALYGFFNDLDPRENEAGPGTICYATLGTAGVDQRFVVTYDNVDYFHQITEFVSDPVTFQIVLYEGSNEAQVNIQDSGNNAGLPPYSDGNKTTIGIEDGDGAQGLSLCGWTDTIKIPDSYAVRFVASDSFGIFPGQQTDTGAPGSTLTFDFEMLNFSSAPVTVALTATGTAGWTATPTPGSVTVAAGGGTTSFSVDVTVAAAADPGDLGTTTVTGTSGGNTTTATILIYTTHGDSDWQGTADLPEATTYATLVSDGDYLYTLAGRTLDATTWVVTDNTARWDPAVNGWDDCAIAELPNTVTMGGACAMNGHIYYVGGLTQLEDAGPPLVPAMFLEDLLDYDIAADTWTVRTGPTYATMSPNVACDPASDTVFVYGGLVDVNQNYEAELPSTDLPDNPDTSAPVFQAYDVATDTWDDSETGTTLDTPDPDFGLYDAAVGVLGGQIYFTAGSHYEVDATTGALQNFTTVGTDLYDIAGNTWSTDVPWLPSFVTGRAGVVYRGQLCVIGGTDTTATTLVAVPDWWCLAGDTWVQQSDPVTPTLLYFGAAVLDDFVYLAGGNDDAGELVASSERWPSDTGLPAAIDPVICAADADADGDADVGADADADGTGDVAADADADGTTDGPRPDGTTDGTTDTAADGGGGGGDDGCSCSVAQPVGAGSLVSLLLGLGAALLIRRRRSS